MPNLVCDLFTHSAAATITPQRLPSFCSPWAQKMSFAWSACNRCNRSPRQTCHLLALAAQESFARGTHAHTTFEAFLPSLFDHRAASGQTSMT